MCFQSPNPSIVKYPSALAMPSGHWGRFKVAHYLRRAVSCGCEPGKNLGLEEETLESPSNPISQVLW